MLRSQVKLDPTYLEQTNIPLQNTKLNLVPCGLPHGMLVSRHVAGAAWQH